MTTPSPERERLAKLIAAELGYEWDGERAIYENKSEYIGDRGKRGHDVNTPYKADFRNAADALLAAGWRHESEMWEEAAKFVDGIQIANALDPWAAAIPQDIAAALRQRSASTPRTGETK